MLFLLMNHHPTTFWEFGKIFGWRNEPSGNSHPTTHHVLAEFFARSWRKLKTMRWQTSNPISGHKKVKHPSSSNLKSSTKSQCAKIIHKKSSLNFHVKSNVRTRSHYLLKYFPNFSIILIFVVKLLLPSFNKILLIC